MFDFNADPVVGVGQDASQIPDVVETFRLSVVRRVDGFHPYLAFLCNNLPNFRTSKFINSKRNM